MRAFAIFPILAASSACAAASTVQTHGGHLPPAVAAPKVTPITRTGKTISGQSLKLPTGDAEMVAASVDIPSGGRIGLHRHPWSRFVYVEKGRVSVINRDTGKNTTAIAGQVIAEVISQWHEAVALDNSPARLIVIDVVPPGVVNMEMPPR